MMNWFLGFIFFACERIVVNSQVWPEGTYGLPKPAVTGCPPNWQEGWRNQDLENTNPSSEFSVGLTSRMDATLTGGDIRRGFCVKTATQIGETSWPAGSYCVYKKYMQCPFGMKSGFIEWDDDDINPNKNNVSGTLPNGTFDHDTIIRYCCQDQGRWTDSIELPVDKPFYLLPHSSSCQRVKGAISTLDYIIYDTENKNNYDKFSRYHVFTNKVKSFPKIYYCYYKGCQHKLQKESGTISTTHFPNYQYCSWSITVDQGSAVSLTFTSINIPSCDGNYMNIYDGLDDTAPIIMSICGDNATSGIRLRSTGNNMFIMLRSGQSSLNGENIQFQADFKTTAPYSGPSWPSGTYGLPKTNTSCPDMWIPGWRKQIMEDDHGKGETSLSTDLLMHMDVAFVDHALTRHFCTKTIDSGGSQKAWPAGKYCIYKKNQCPSSMKDGFIKLDDEDYPNKGGNDKHGILPDGEYGAADTKIFYCCNDAGDWKQSIELPIHEPFFLLPYQSKNCQRVKGALSKLETITYDTEENNNHDDFQRSHTFTDGQKGKPTLYYCYYKGCEYKLETNSGSFGANNYPAYHYCSWSITVKHGLEVFLKFTTLNIPDCSKNQLEVYDGFDNTGSLLAVYCAENATSGNTVRSTGNNMYVMFKSGNDNSGSLQFQARYETKEPITEPAWPSGTYGLPKTTDSCPAGWVQGSRTQDMENDGAFQSAFSSLFDMDAVLDQTGKYVKRKFCMKTFSDGKNKLWPAGSYCIYKKKTCPTSMADGFIHWDDEDNNNNQNKNEKHGILPEGTYGTDTEIYYCCSDQGNWYDPIELPVSVPIFLLPYNSKNCQRVKWAWSKQQYITYDTENTQNRDNFVRRHVYAENKQTDLPTTIYYCYYEDCQYKRNAESSSNISVSTAANQDFQHCSWLLSVRYGNITLTFNSMSVPDCSNDNFIEIFDGPNDQSVSLAKYCGRPTPIGSITSTGKHLLILVKSGNNKQMGTTVSFFATYKNNLPFGFTVPPTTTDIITVRKTTPKRELSTTSAPTKEMPSPATVKVSTAPDITRPRSDVFSSETPQTKTPTEPDITFTSEEKVQSTPKAGIEGGPGKSSGDGNGSSTALAIVIPLCITFLVTVFIVMFFYRRRKMKGNSTQRSTDGGNELPSPEFNARFQSPDKVSIIKDRQRMNMPANEKDNPLYEPGGENHTYCSIEDTQAQYKKEIGLTAKPSQSTLYETPVDPGASTSSNSMPNPYQISPLTTSSPPKLPPKNINYETPADPDASLSSFNPLYSKGSDNTSPNTPTFPFPSPSDSDTPLLSTSYDTPQSHYNTPNNPYETMIPNDTQGAYAVSPMNQPPRASYENVPNGNNNPHYQTPSTKPEGNVYEVMHGRDPQVNLPDNTGVTQC